MRCKEKRFQEDRERPNPVKYQKACAASDPIWDIGTERLGSSIDRPMQCSDREAQAVLDWLVTKDKHARMIGSDILEAIVGDGPPLPTQFQFDGLTRVCDEERERSTEGSLVIERTQTRT